jgi:hypothetical protein
VVQIVGGSIFAEHALVASGVRVLVSHTGDSHAAGRARLKLKLAAIAYVNVRHGIDADARVCRAGLGLLCTAALEYYRALMPAGTPVGVVGNGDLRGTEQLQLGAVAYVNARHGVDGDAGLARVGLALLCSVSIEYAESRIGADPKKRPVDPQLQQLNGE